MKTRQDEDEDEDEEDEDEEDEDEDDDEWCVLMCVKTLQLPPLKGSDGTGAPTRITLGFFE